ncbi:hypothetical protein EYF80_052800 [Liparis tanakae]|uniref:Uncharacterized protein n=1 Tax=Liparis tanakae TaxID=230148 RepID=A0A4Z2F804_9TELE|nr:hypothetical protein EYF80_052800 [Liparis tanakae]
MHSSDSRLLYPAPPAGVTVRLDISLPLLSLTADTLSIGTRLRRIRPRDVTGTGSPDGRSRSEEKSYERCRRPSGFHNPDWIRLCSVRLSWRRRGRYRGFVSVWVLSTPRCRPRWSTSV